MFRLCRCYYRQYGVAVIRLGIKEFLQAARETLFPLSCLACAKGLPRRQQVSYCAACRQDIRMLQEPFCITCAKPFPQAAGKSHLCSHCLRNDWHFKQARAVVQYRPPVSEAVKMFKYRGTMHGLATFAALSRQYLKNQPLAQPDLLIPVPLHTKRLRQRGFNQALILCRKIFPDWKDKIDPHILDRQSWTRPQTGLSGAERRRNVRNAFMVSNPAKIKNKTVLLVDDVFTTGATVNECARILVKSKAAQVDVFTFARAID